MAVFVYMIVFAVVLMAYAFMTICVNKSFVQCVEAGSTEHITAKELKKMSLYQPTKKLYDNKGSLLDPKMYFKIVVNGSCLEPKNICNKDFLIVKRLNQDEVGNLPAGSVIMIHLDDTGVDKIREVVSVGSESIETQYYLDNGKAQRSSKPHLRSNVVGVVKYKI